MPDIVLHIGLHKTGTTTLQHQYFPACRDIEFFTRDRPEMLKFILLVTRKDQIYFNPEEARNILWQYLRNDRTNVLSEESFSGPPHAGFTDFGLDHRKPVLDNLENTFPEAKVIMVLRRQDSLARSLYRQYLSMCGTRKIGRFYGLKPSDHRAMVPLDRFCFKPYVDEVARSFPKGVLLLAYEEFVADAAAYFKKINEFIGMKRPILNLRRENATRLGSIGMEFTRLLNHFFRGYHNPGGLFPGWPSVENSKLTFINPSYIIHNRWPGRGSVDKNSDYYRISHQILELFRDDNEALDKKYDIGLKKYSYY